MAQRFAHVFLRSAYKFNLSGIFTLYFCYNVCYRAFGGMPMNHAPNGSRPKIHKLPHLQEQESRLYASRGVLVICLAVLLAAGIPALWSWHKGAKPVSRSAVVQPATANATALASPEDIPVQDDTGQIVGQLTKMPADSEQGASIHSTAKLDPESGKQLLNIISKY